MGQGVSMFKSILVGLDSGKKLDIVEQYALELAKYFKSSVTGMHVVDVRKLYSPFVEDVFYSAGLVTVSSCHALVEERLGKVADLIQNHFQSACDKHGLPSEFIQRRGVVPDELSQEARKHDLIVIGTKGEHSAIEEVVLGSTFSEVIRQVNRPVIVVPNACEKFYIRRILVAYDGSDKASNALNVITSSVREHNLEVELLVCRDGLIDEPDRIYSEAEAFLSHHNVKWSGRIVRGDAVECILEHADAANCDMLAFGTSGSSMVKQLFVGSVANELLQKTKLPCLLMK
jgi:nucleotide-binding universal stress UspA family protein